MIVANLIRLAYNNTYLFCLKQGLSYKVPERSEWERGAAPLINLPFPAGRD